MRILVVGAGGQLGRALAGARLPHEILALDRGRLEITDLAAVRQAVAAGAPDVVVNAAAYNAVDRAETERDDAYRANALGPRNLALATAEYGVPILHVSTDYVFDGGQRHPYHEYDVPRPLSVYAASKLAGERAVRETNPRHYVVRTAWLYHSEGSNFPLTILDQARKGPLRVVADQHGSPTYAPHLAAGIGRLVETGAYGTYHLAGCGGTTWFDLARALLQAAGLEAHLEQATAAEFPRPAPRPAYSVLTTLQEPRILLPPWQQGVDELSRALRG
jgi:dTDP-4-dehydrorhamnose reductase